MYKSIFTAPKLSKAKKGWYVHFRYNGQQKRYKKGLNRIKNLKDRELYFNELKRQLHEKLKKGWNPNDVTQSFFDDMYICDALDFSLNKKKMSIAPKTYSGYKGTVKYVKMAIDELSLNYLVIDEVKRRHIRLIIEKGQQLRKWSNKTYNQNLNYLSAIFDELLHWDIIEINPCTKIRRLKVEESIANRVPTSQEHQTIKTELSLNHPFFCSFIETEYHTGIRPKEILSIQLNMIDLENREINLPPVITKTKTRKRKVIINNHLFELFYAMELHTYPQDYYLFGSYREKGRGNNGRKLDFIPGPTQLKRDTATKRWKKIVKDGLGIDVNMYAYKHKGADDKILNGVDLDSLRNQLGHSTKKMTSTYAREIKGVYKKDIIDNSPEF